MSRYSLNWTTEHLHQLKEITNHKIVFDGYEFVWMHKLDGKWDRHYIKNFEEYKMPFSWLMEALHTWKVVYNQRMKDYLKEMSKGLDVDVQVSHIYKDHELKTSEKIKQMLDIKPSLTNKDIAQLLEMTNRGVRRHVNNIKNLNR